MTRPGIEPRSLGPLANTLTIMPMSGYTVSEVLFWKAGDAMPTNSYFILLKISRIGASSPETD